MKNPPKIQWNWKSVSLILGRFWGGFAFGTMALLVIGMVFRRSRAEQKAAATLQKTVKSGTNEPMTLHPEIDPLLCAGCGACVKACPEGEILQLINHKAVLVEPTKCVGHGECEASCPFSAISLVFGTKTRGMELPRLTSHYETNVAGLYIAGELGGMGLIRNAVKQGRLASEHAIHTLSRGGAADYDILIVGAGPAGLSASLATMAAKRSYLCIEQNNFGGTIANFPRQKVVMSHPAELPVFGKMRFPRNKVSKEELLALWEEIRNVTKLQIKEQCKFVNMTPQGSLFAVETSLGRVTARKVILAMGVRGTPRRLGLPNEDLPKVTYNLIEPDQYQNCHVAVVGGGNAGVEAAQQLGHPRLGNRVTLLVRSATFDRCNQENQDIIMAMAQQKRVTICFNTVVSGIGSDHLELESEGRRTVIKNDFLFIFAGAEMPFKFLQGLGVAIDKKFGERRNA